MLSRYIANPLFEVCQRYEPAMMKNYSPYEIENGVSSDDHHKAAACKWAIVGHSNVLYRLEADEHDHEEVKHHWWYPSTTVSQVV